MATYYVGKNASYLTLSLSPVLREEQVAANAQSLALADLLEVSLADLPEATAALSEEEQTRLERQAEEMYLQVEDQLWNKLVLSGDDPGTPLRPLAEVMSELEEEETSEEEALALLLEGSSWAELTASLSAGDWD